MRKTRKKETEGRRKRGGGQKQNEGVGMEGLTSVIGCKKVNGGEKVKQEERGRWKYKRGKKKTEW